MLLKADRIAMGRGQKRHTVAVIETVGRMGNQIILLANLIALSMATGVNIAHPTFGSYANYFTGTIGNLFCRYPQGLHRRKSRHRIARIAVYKICRFLDKAGILNFVAPGRTFESDYQSQVDMTATFFIARVMGGRFTFLSKGWFFQYSPVSKNDFLQELRDYFQLVEPHSGNVARLISAARQNCDILIGVHIRHTDFKEHAGGRYYFETAAYYRLMNHCRTLFPMAQVKFFVVSDGPRTPSEFPALECCFGSGHEIEDMYCLGGCDYIIGPIASSYSLWPAVLFQKPTFRMSSAQDMPGRDDFKLTMEPWVDTSGGAR